MFVRRRDFYFATALSWFLTVPGAPLAAKADTRLSGVPNFQTDYPAASLHQYVLGPVCLSLRMGRLDLDCNPAFLAYERKNQFRLNLAFNENIKQVSDYRRKLEDGDSLGIINRVLQEPGPLVAQATTALWYQYERWAIGYMPFRGGFASRIRNPAYPEVTANVYKESEAFAKGGWAISDDRQFVVGLQMRYVERQFFRRQFDLLDLVGDPAQFPIEKQNALYLEPGVAYAFDFEWLTSVSATVTQIPVYQAGAVGPGQPVFDCGFTTSPPIGDQKRLRTSAHFSTNPAYADLFSRFRWGALLILDHNATVSFSVGRNNLGIGIDGHFDSLVLGFGWKAEDVMSGPPGGANARVSSAIVEAGLVF